MPRNLFSACCFLRFFVVAAIALACAGCESKSPVGRVHGKVNLDGQPLSSGSVVTIPPAGRGARGVIKNGQFDLSTSGTNDGALIGMHKVAVTAREQSQGTGPEAGSGKLLVPERYTNPDSSGLTINVQSGSNDVVLELSSAEPKK